VTGGASEYATAISAPLGDIALVPVLAYHADDDIVRVWIVGGVVGAAAVAVVAVVLAPRLPSGPGGGAGVPAVAIGVAALTGALAATGFYVLMIVAPISVFFGVTAVARLPRTGSKPLALAALVASLLALDLLLSAYVACGITDACFH
jgi:hypothetical protein